ncbi:MAG: cell envelope integrity protein TolA [Legionella sp.]|uniref:cell envelope integrity protein TolA n=1 Tax=Legionella sp. TaxID=459 RepID=UPI0039E71C71
MINSPTYRNAFFVAIGLHLFIIVMLLSDNTTKRPVLTPETQNTPGLEQPIAVTLPQQEVVKAVSMDNKQVMETVNRLKEERAQQQRAEMNRQRVLQRQAEAAKQQRIKEQQQIVRLKEEANRIAIARKKQAEEEKKRLKQLTEQKAQEAKRIEELKKQKEELVKQQQLEAKRLEELNKRKLAEKEKEDKLKAERVQAAKEHTEQLAKAEAEKKRQAQVAAAQDAERQARIAGEVDKYKALIVNAISRNWILPENVDSTLSSQFRIRLAPDGAVLEVTLTRSSGDPLLDRSAQTAIYKASPLPVPKDASTFNMFRDISLTVRPEQVRG